MSDAGTTAKATGGEPPRLLKSLIFIAWTAVANAQRLGAPWARRVALAAPSRVAAGVDCSSWDGDHVGCSGCVTSGECVYNERTSLCETVADTEKCPAGDFGPTGGEECDYEDLKCEMFSDECLGCADECSDGGFERCDDVLAICGIGKDLGEHHEDAIEKIEEEVEELGGDAKHPCAATPCLEGKFKKCAMAVEAWCAPVATGGIFPNGEPEVAPATTCTAEGCSAFMKNLRANAVDDVDYGGECPYARRRLRRRRVLRDVALGAVTVSEDCGERSVVEQDMAEYLRRFAEGEAPGSDVHTYWLDALTERCFARSAHDGLTLPRASDRLARDVGPALTGDCAAGACEDSTCPLGASFVEGGADVAVTCAVVGERRWCAQAELNAVVDVKATCPWTCDAACGNGDASLSGYTGCPCEAEGCAAVDAAPLCDRALCAPFKAEVVRAVEAAGGVQPVDEHWLRGAVAPGTFAAHGEPWTMPDFDALAASDAGTACGAFARSVYDCVETTAAFCNEIDWEDEACGRASTCGDGLLTWGEDCDDGAHFEAQDGCVGCRRDPRKACAVAGEACATCVRPDACDGAGSCPFCSLVAAAFHEAHPDAASPCDPASPCVGGRVVDLETARACDARVDAWCAALDAFGASDPACGIYERKAATYATPRVVGGNCSYVVRSVDVVAPGMDAVSVLVVDQSDCAADEDYDFDGDGVALATLTPCVDPFQEAARAAASYLKWKATHEADKDPRFASFADLDVDGLPACAAADVRGSAYVGVRVLGAVKGGQLDDGADESRALLDALAAGDATLSFGRRLVQADVGCVDETCAYGVERCTALGLARRRVASDATRFSAKMADLVASIKDLVGAGTKADYAARAFAVEALGASSAIHDARALATRVLRTTTETVYLYDQEDYCEHAEFVLGERNEAWEEDPCCNPIRRYEQCCERKDVEAGKRVVVEGVDEDVARDECTASVVDRVAHIQRSLAESATCREKLDVSDDFDRDYDQFWKFKDECLAKVARATR
ncbi:hypothetical protein JL720_435 [Aureococcus anophagefferens]|nr:hypothetical protein JL720_435 [Aureococcus anophagefferens]